VCAITVPNNHKNTRVVTSQPTGSYLVRLESGIENVVFAVAFVAASSNVSQLVNNQALFVAQYRLPEHGF
jgi:hypothetical protein